MFYRYEDQVINMRDIVNMGKNFMIGQKVWLIQLMTKVGPTAMKFPDAETRDKVFEEMYKKMQELK
jgi:hypothetical protein